MKDKKLTPAAKLLYGEIRVLEQGKVGLCIASSDRLAHDLGVTKRTVNRALAQLEEAGLIERTTEGKRKSVTTNEWSASG